jgi:predicted SAM-dependent methyltransferase
MSVDKLQCADLQSINCITLWHVLEHIHPLKEAISRFHTLLERNGYLIIAVPNTESYDAKYYKENWAAYDVPRHLYHFSPESINNLITPIGFKLLKTLPMYFDSTYVSILSEKHMTINNKKPSGSICIIKGIFRGLTSNLYGLVNYSNYSSLIYIYRKEF